MPDAQSQGQPHRHLGHDPGRPIHLHRERHLHLGLVQSLVLGPVELGQQRDPPAVMIDAVAYMRVEVAIGAFRQAERPVDIDGERCGR